MQTLMCWDPVGECLRWLGSFLLQDASFTWRYWIHKFRWQSSAPYFRHTLAYTQGNWYKMLGSAAVDGSGTFSASFLIPNADLLEITSRPTWHDWEGSWRALSTRIMWIGIPNPRRREQTLSRDAWAVNRGACRRCRSLHSRSTKLERPAVVSTGRARLVCWRGGKSRDMSDLIVWAECIGACPTVQQHEWRL